MNKTEQKAFERLIKEAAHKSVLRLSDVSFDLRKAYSLNYARQSDASLMTQYNDYKNCKTIKGNEAIRHNIKRMA